VTHIVKAALALSSAAAMLLAGCTGTKTAGAAPQAGPVAAAAPARTREQLIELGRQHKSAFELYEVLRQEANGGRRLTPGALPDWTGVYTRARGHHLRSRPAARWSADGEADPRVQRAPAEARRGCETRRRIRSHFDVRASGTPAVADRTVPS
jgi:hypothetical protein